MMRAFHILLVCIIWVGRLQAQYGNEWINYSQKYLEFKITEEGLYRIEHAALSSAISQSGLGNLDTLNPAHIQIFGRGKEVRLHIEGGTDQSFDVGDYIEFFAEGNDGWFDSLLYTSPNDQINPYYSLFNDTATYYLTWNTSFTNLRYTNISDVNFPPAGQAEPYLMRTLVNRYFGSYFLGRDIGQKKYDTHYTKGEGWVGQFNSGSPLVSNLETVSPYSGSGAPDAVFKTRVASNNNPVGATGFNHHLQISYGSSSTVVVDDQWQAYDMREYSFAIPVTALGNGSTPITFNGVPVYGASGQTKGLGFASLTYAMAPADFNALGYLRFTLPASPSQKSYISGQNFSKSPVSCVYDLTGGIRNVVVHSVSTGALQFALPAGGEKECLVAADSSTRSVTALKSVTATGSFTNYGAMDPDSAFIMITHRSLWSMASQYASYRNTAAMNSVLVDVAELYDQFAFGINSHPLAIRNFAEFAINEWSTPPKYLFLVGKSIRMPTIGTGADGAGSRNSLTNYAANLVPTYGYPSCDNAFTAGLNGTLYEPAIPTGRLAAKSAAEVQSYYLKVREFENAQVHNYFVPNVDEWLWQKRVMHFGGGGPGEAAVFKGYLQAYQDTIEKEFFGASVHEFYKASANIIDYNLADSIKSAINNGVALMTFFGHSSNNSFDVSIDHAVEYNNKGKYFFMIANGCFSGDIHQPFSISTSEEFVLIPDKGAIGFIAGTHLGLAGYLNQYTRLLYSKFGHTLYGKSMAQCMQAVSKELGQQNPNDDYLKSTIFEMTLHGDPALKAYPHPKVDYALVSPGRVYFDPPVVTSDLDSFQINIVVSNLGMATGDDYNVSIRRLFADGNSITYDVTQPHVYYQDTISMKLPVDLANGIGLNQFEIKLDPANFVDEVSEANNGLMPHEVELWIQSNELIPVFPYNCAVVPNFNDTLKASTSDPFAPTREYVLQIDTTDTYDSPLFQEVHVTQAGGVVRWKPTLGYQADSVVYFWRASPWNTDPDSLRWREHSFQYIQGKRGWGQDHYFQFKNDKYDKIVYDRPNRNFTYDAAAKSLTANNWGNPTSQTQYKDIRYMVNGIEMASNICNGHITPVIFVAVIDPLTLQPWGTADIVSGDTLNYPQHDFGNGNNLNESYPNNCFVGVVEYNFSFMTEDPAQMAGLKNMLNAIPDGHYILLYSGARVLWQSNAVLNGTNSPYPEIVGLGATNPATLSDRIPWIYFVKKGDPGTRLEAIGTTINDFISIDANMENTGNYGEAYSTIIGPAAAWGSLHWKTNPQENGAQDSVMIEVLNLQNQPIVSFLATSGDELNIGSMVDASIYPYLRLRARAWDTQNYSSPFFDRWHLLYEYVPEAALNQVNGFLMEAGSANEGDDMRFAIAIENISDRPMDSLRVLYWVEDQFNNKHPIAYSKQDSLRVGQVLLDTMQLSTFGLAGRNVLWVDVNPEDSLWQLEQYHFNNVARIQFNINPDRINPMLDVTFDGVHILNGDIVSPDPLISIQLKDENQYLILNEDADTANFRVYLTTPDGSTSQVFFTRGGVTQMTYVKASAPENRFKIEYHPQSLSDGVYKLQVQAADKAGNASGKTDYYINFEVVNASTITRVMNYPNPFSTRTRFAFTLTGSDVPEVFTIQILTVTGKVVREITKDELGPIQIGRNLTQFEWDGTDEFGDRLANGVYLYRVMTKLNGENIERRESGADAYFTKEFGKMYLMR